MRPRRLLPAAVLLLSLVAATAVWYGRRDETRGLEHDGAAMVAVLLRAIPPGTPIEEARRHVQSRGFHCELQTNADWLQWPTGGGAVRATRRGIDLVYCQRLDIVWLFVRVHHVMDFLRVPFPFEQDWRVGLVHSDGVVVEILANETLTGP